ncbi:MAG: hypothetical protein ACE5EK_03020 [Nitrospinales bacterium]
MTPLKSEKCNKCGKIINYPMGVQVNFCYSCGSIIGVPKATGEQPFEYFKQGNNLKDSAETISKKTRESIKKELKACKKILEDIDFFKVKPESVIHDWDEDLKLLPRTKPNKGDL